jgi:hypothetical protein
MIRRLLSREGRAPVRITGTPPAVRVVDMPPRPPEGRQPLADDIPWRNAACMKITDPRLDPSGAPPMEVA